MVQRSIIMNNYTGSNFDEFLKEDGAYEEVTAKAHKRMLAIQLSEAMKRGNIIKQEFADKLQTSRSQLDRLLDPDNTAITLESLERLAIAVGGKLRIELA